MFDLTSRNNVRIIAAAKAKHVDLIAPNVEADQCLNYGKHCWVVRPYTAVYKRVPPVLKWSEVGGGGRCGESYIDHALKTIEFVIRMVRRFEHKDFAVFSLKCGNAKAGRRLA